MDSKTTPLHSLQFQHMTAEEPLKTIIAPASARYTDRGSRFYAFAYPVMDLESIENRRTEVTKKIPDATHHCYAWRMDPFSPQEFTQDDGEPGSTAGMPILGVIKSEGLINVLIIVARYFGGTKLGKPGLIHAYRESAQLALADVQTTHLDRFVPLDIRYPYEQENRIRELINRFRLETGDETYLEQVSLTLFCRSADFPEIRGILDHLSYLDIRYSAQPECFRPSGARF